MFVINTPSLNYLKLKCSNSKSHHFLVEKMPELKEASLDVSFPYIKKLVRSITSVKLLKLCLGSSEVNQFSSSTSFLESSVSDYFNTVRRGWMCMVMVWSSTSLNI